MKKVLIFGFALLVLTGCASGIENENGDKTRLHIQRIDVDGKTVTCVLYRPPSGGGLDCDWDSGG